MNNMNDDKFINKRYIICKNPKYINIIKDYWVLKCTLCQGRFKKDYMIR